VCAIIFNKTAFNLLQFMCSEVNSLRTVLLDKFDAIHLSLQISLRAVLSN
jgi:hypothetical protein